MLLSDPMFQTGIGLFDDEKEEENIFSTMPHKPPSKTVDAVFGNSSPPDEPTITPSNNARKVRNDRLFISFWLSLLTIVFITETCWWCFSVCFS